MPQPDDHRPLLERFADGSHCAADVDTLYELLRSGQLVLATGQRAVAVGGNVNDAVILTGDGSVVLTLHGDRADALREILSPPRPHRLSGDVPDFIGRRSYVGQLLRRLRSPQPGAAISAVQGMGGVGKTALAVHVAQMLEDEYPDGQIEVDMRGSKPQPLASADAMGSVIHAFLPEVRLPEEASQVTDLYRTVLQGKRVLILLDDALCAAQVQPLVPPAPSTLLVTSRLAIDLPGLQQFHLDTLLESESIQLLRRVCAPRSLSKEQRIEITVVCGWLPLALRAAGSFLKLHIDWTVEEYIAALSEEGLARLPEVERVLGLSAAQLAREQPELTARWQMLSIFPSEFDRAGAAAVWDVGAEVARDGLASLLQRNLLLFDQRGRRYRLHDLMRPVARKAFSYGDVPADAEVERQRLADAEARHAAHYCKVLADANDLYLKGGEAIQAGLGLYDTEADNIRTGQAWAAADADEDDDAAALCSDYSDAGAHVLDLRLHARRRID